MSKRRLYFPFGSFCLDVNQYYPPSTILSFNNEQTNLFASILKLNLLTTLPVSQYRYAILYILNFNQLLGSGSQVRQLSDSELDLSFQLSQLDSNTTLNNIYKNLLDSSSNVMSSVSKNEIKFLYVNCWKDIDSFADTQLKRKLTEIQFNEIVDKICSELKSNYYPHKNLTHTLLSQSFTLIDDLICDGKINLLCKVSNKPLQFTVSSRMTSTGATTCVKPDGIEIKFSDCFSILKDDVIYQNSGLPCKGPLQCIVVTMMHELVHVLVQIVCSFRGKKLLQRDDDTDSDDTDDDSTYNNSNAMSNNLDQKVYSSHGVLFKSLAYYYFGLTDIKHSMFKSGHARTGKLAAKLETLTISANSIISQSSGPSGPSGPLGSGQLGPLGPLESGPLGSLQLLSQSQKGLKQRQTKATFNVNQKVRFTTPKLGTIKAVIVSLGPKRAKVQLADGQRYYVGYEHLQI